MKSYLKIGKTLKHSETIYCFHNRALFWNISISLKLISIPIKQNIRGFVRRCKGTLSQHTASRMIILVQPWFTMCHFVIHHLLIFFRTFCSSTAAISECHIHYLAANCCSTVFDPDNVSGKRRIIAVCYLNSMDIHLLPY